MIRTVRTCLALSILILGLPAAGEVWHLAPGCGPDDQARYTDFERQLRAAEPGSPMYLPHPFPKTDAEVFQDLVHGFRPAPGRPGRSVDRPFLEAVDHGRATYQVHRVATWSPAYCGRRQAQPFVHLVQVFDGDREISRGTVAPSGQVGTLVHWKESLFPDDPPPVPADPGALLRDRLEELPRAAHQFQYVTVWGSVRCPELIPCVAFRAGPDAYVWWREPATDREALLRIAPDHGRFSVRERMGDARSRGAFLRSFQGSPEEVVTLGGDVMALAVRVDDPAPRR